MATDSNAVDLALVALLGDPALAALMPGGVFFDYHKGPVTQFVIVSAVTHLDDAKFGGTNYEVFRYLVKAVEKETTGANVKAASARIHALLMESPLVASGYTHMQTERVGRVRFTAIDEVDQDGRWQHRGGVYEVWMSPD